MDDQGLSPEPVPMTSGAPGAAVPAAASRPADWMQRSPRLASLGVLAACAAALGIGRLVHPSPAGYGTHQQLFMPPCFFRLTTGLPCPFCGTTTGFAHILRGEFAEAFACNPIALPVFALLVLVVVMSLYGIVTGRPWVPGWVYSARTVRIVFVIVLIVWVYNLVHLFLL